MLALIMLVVGQMIISTFASVQKSMHALLYLSKLPELSNLGGFVVESLFK